MLSAKVFCSWDCYFENLAGTFDNIILHGRPDRRCATEVKRKGLIQEDICSREAHLDRYLNCKKYLDRETLLKSFLSHTRKTMYYCASLQPVDIVAKNYLNRLSRLSLTSVSHCIHSEDSLYFVSFFGNSHGSWVEIRTEMVKYSSVRLQMEPICSWSGFPFRYPCIPIVLFKYTSVVPLLDIKSQSYMTWIESYNRKTSAKFNIHLQTEILNSTNELDDFNTKMKGYIQQNIWEGTVILSPVKVFCLALPGDPISGHIAISKSQHSVDFGHSCSQDDGFLQLFWIHDHLDKENVWLDEDLQICVEDLDNPHQKMKRKINSLYLTTGTHMGLELLNYLHTINHKQKWPKSICHTDLTTHVHIVVTASPYFYCATNKETTSWYIASEKCRNVGRTLPILQTRDEMETFIMFLGRKTQSVRQDLPSERSKEIVLVGLKYSFKYKVSTLKSVLSIENFFMLNIYAGSFLVAHFTGPFLGNWRPVSFTAFDEEPVTSNRQYKVLLYEQPIRRFEYYYKYLNIGPPIFTWTFRKCYNSSDLDNCSEQVARDLHNEILTKTNSCEYSMFKGGHSFVVESRDLANLIQITPDTDTCTLMLLDNPVRAQWVNIDCNTKIASSVFCFASEKINISSSHTVLGASALFCARGQLAINETCFEPKMRNVLSAKKFKPVYSLLEHLVKHIIKCVSEPFPLFFTSNYSQVFTILHCSSIYKFKLIQVGPLSVATLLNMTNQINPTYGGNVLLCDAVLAISITNLCDGKVDCLTKDMIDESMCTCNRSSNYSNHCKFVVEGSASLNCSDFYVSTKNECHFYPMKNKYKTNVQTYPEESCAGFTQALLSPKLILMYQADCVSFGKFSCKKGTTCFSYEHICVFKVNKCEKLIPCKFGSYLENCKDFNCNTAYKCPNFYCIPLGYVCNGRWDCPLGLEELGCGQQTNCSNLYSCQSSNLCVHPDDVCDGNTDCPQDDDKYFCVLHTLKCPPSCHCLYLVVRCFSTNVSLSLLILSAKFEVFLCQKFVSEQYSRPFNSK